MGVTSQKSAEIILYYFHYLPLLQAADTGTRIVIAIQMTVLSQLYFCMSELRENCTSLQLKAVDINFEAAVYVCTL